MEEIKIKKKLNKKPLIICLALAIVFGIIGFIDIKSNAAETEYKVSVKFHQVMLENGKPYDDYIRDGGSFTSNSPIYIFYNEHLDYVTDHTVHYYVLSQEYFLRDGYGNQPSTITDKDGNVWYYHLYNYGSVHFSGYTSTVDVIVDGAEKEYILDKLYNREEFVSAFSNGTLDYTQVIDYDNLPIDDDMPCVSEIKRNYIINHYSSPGEEGITQPSDTYEYLIWVNSSDLPIQLEVIPVVQYYKTLFGKSDFLDEYIGEWREFELLDSGTTKYLRQTDDASLLEKYNEDYQFKKTCLSERSVNIFTETAYFFYGYRVRYVDIENEKAGPWTVVMPSQTVNESEKWQEYSDGSVSNSSNSSGEVSDTNYGDVDKNLEEIEENINFKDKYEVVDGNADTQEVMNWLNTVVSFIKGTPNIVTSVLSFLPQPILYGMYITIFLGCIASAIAIIKALI